MALVECPECSNKISEHAISCPKCGCPTTHLKKTSTSGRNPEDSKEGFTFTTKRNETFNTSDNSTFKAKINGLFKDKATVSVVIIILLLIPILYVGSGQITKIREKNESTKRDYYIKNKEAIHKNIERNFVNKDFEEIIKVISDYKSIAKNDFKYIEDRLVEIKKDTDLYSRAVVRTYIEKMANDPSSIVFENLFSTKRADGCWDVYATYRGNNLLGGKVRNRTKFLVCKGSVITHD